MYKIVDLQGGDLKKDRIYTSLEEIREDLQNFHSQDYLFLDGYASLLDLLEIGKWAITDMQGEEIEAEYISI
jgi:hypothetical protein